MANSRVDFWALIYSTLLIYMYIYCIVTMTYRADNIPPFTEKISSG